MPLGMNMGMPPGMGPPGMGMPPVISATTLRTPFALPTCPLRAVRAWRPPGCLPGCPQVRLLPGYAYRLTQPTRTKLCGPNAYRATDPRRTRLYRAYTCTAATPTLLPSLHMKCNTSAAYAYNATY
eukprot:1622305-Rhodomonas_salina.1